MCQVLQISRSTYYYESKKIVENEDDLHKKIIDIFHDSYDNYGTRKIKVELEKIGLTVSRRKIGKIMKENGLFSSYTIAKYKVHKTTCNESEVSNELNRDFKTEKDLAIVVSDLTYVRVEGKWNYICLLLDLFNREVIGYSCGRHKDSALVSKAFSMINGNLKKIEMFHTDRGNEFKNTMIDDILRVFEIKRSLSMKGCPYDNAVAEATFKIFKTEFINRENFKSLDELEAKLSAYVYWYNNKRIHGTLNYMSPIQFKNSHN
jgi:transposase InsO family protein